MSGYVGVVAALVVASALTQDSAGPALYLVALCLTLPAGVFIVPGLWVNLFALSGIVKAFGVGPDAERLIFWVGVTTVFILAALANSLLARLTWRSMRRRR